MRPFKSHLITSGSTVKEALTKLNELGQDAILFVVNEDLELIGSLTDGDVRRGLLKNFTIENSVNEIIQEHPRFIRKGERDISKIIEYRKADLRIIPILDEHDRVVNVINFRYINSYLPIDAVIMAGGKGTRLRPLTEKIPKPLLPVGGKPIVEHNIDRLALFGIDDYWITIKYLGEQIESYFGNGDAKNIQINYVKETEALGTIGAVSKINNFEHDYVLVTNSDILTNLDYELFFLDFIKNDADFALVSIPYHVNIPYAVLETQDNRIKGFKEKPTYTYYSNGGIYLMKRTVLDLIPNNTFFNATDLIEKLIGLNKKVVTFPFSGYWLDVGKHEDYNKAQEDIKQIQF